MTRTASYTALFACLGMLLLAPRPAAADGANVARFLVNNSLQVKAKPRTTFDKAYGRLQAAARVRGAARLKRPTVMLSQTSKRTITGVTNGLRPTTMTAKRELLFDGKRAYLRLTTSSKGLRPNSTTSTVRVPVGRLFGWYGKKLVQAQFPKLTPQQVQRGLGQLQGAEKRQGLGQRINAYMAESYAAFGRTIAP
jgi:hypothetical protein